MSNATKWAGLFAALTVAAPAAVQAQEEISPINTGNISLEVSADVVTEYWFRGISQGMANDQGFIFQPGADIGVALYEDDNVSVGGYVGTWNSFNTNGVSDSSMWYESDVYAGVGVGLPMNLNVDLAYVLLYGPAGGDEFAQEIDLTVAYDDSQLWADMGVEFAGFAGLQPYALFAFETSGASDGQDEGVYLELGVEPSFLVYGQDSDYPVTLSIPVAVGLSLDDYYEVEQADGSFDDSTYGFTSAGAVVSVPLPFIPEEYGVWQASAGVTALFLSDDLEDLSAAAGTGDDSIQIIGSVGVSMTY